MCSNAQWRLKIKITADVVPSIDPSIYTGNTNSLKSTYKQKLKLYAEYEEHKRNTIKAIQTCFDENLLTDLESSGILVGYIPMEVYGHIWDNFLLPVDKDRKILLVKKLLKIDYNPDRISQHYYKAVNDARLLLTALEEIVTDKEVKRNVYAIFGKNMDLKEACQEWNRKNVTSWNGMKKHFSNEIQMNMTDPFIM